MKKKGTASKKGNSILKRSSNVLNIKGMVFAALFAALTAAVSPIKIPLGFTPVPITLQTLMVLLSGAVLGSRLGALSQFLYVLVGALGLPVFAGGGSGLGALLGPSGGYLISYPFAAFITGKMIEKKKLNFFLKYASFVLALLLVLIVFADFTLKLGIIKLWDAASKSYLPMASMISSTQRLLFIVISIAII